MSGGSWWPVLLTVVGVTGTALVASLLSQEVSYLLDRFPMVLVRLAARRLPLKVRAELVDEWTAELDYILKASDSLPVARLFRGMRFALGLLRGAAAISREVRQGSSPGIIRYLQQRIVQDISRNLTLLAVIIAGRKRDWRAEEWDASRPSGAMALLRWASGLVRAAISMRLGDLVRLLGRMLDWFLAEPRTEYFVFAITIGTAGYFLISEGVPGLLHGLDNILAAATLTGIPALWLRRRRQIPPRRRRRRQHDQSEE